jgi:hypothetical protein
MFNALRYTKKLEEVGFTREQAEAHIEIMTEVIETNLATKQDMKDLRVEMAQLENRLTIKLGTIVSLAIGIAVTLAKLI